MKMLLVGGKLQGTEIAFLAREAGWGVTLVDRDPAPLAMRLCDESIRAEASCLSPGFLERFDIVFPAFEDLEGLVGLRGACEEAGVPFVFDEKAYRISMSKRATNAFLSKHGIKVPPSFGEEIEWAGGYFVKPDSESGSNGARRFASRAEAEVFLQDHPSHIGQVFLEGPVLSIEVVCDRGAVEAYSVTEVVVKEDYDCHRIVAPADVSDSAKRLMTGIGLSIGRALDMRGIFDVEAIVHDGEPYVLEIDARMPSQTPIAVYCATGVNLVVEAARRFLPGGTARHQSARSAPGFAILQHVRLEDGALELVGEGALADSSPLSRADGLYGADVALLGADDRGSARYATLVVVGGGEFEVASKLESVLLKASRGDELP